MIGKIISHYKILDKLGEGGMGVVYKAHDTKLDRTVALKLLPSHVTPSEEDKQRFIREAKSAAALNHPHICTIHSVDEHAGNQFIVMEYIDGVTLRKKLETENNKLETAVTYAIQIAEALSEAHKKGIVHRDIKPDNIMVTADNRLKITDFGLAQLKGTAQVTQAGQTVGTVAYMSPEQVRGEQTDARSDIWSFGIVLYEMITGRSPFAGDYEHAIMYSIVNADPPLLSNVVKNIPYELEQIVCRCIAKNPSERYQSASELIDDLIDGRDSVKTGTSRSTKELTKRSIRQPINKRRKIATGTAITVGILLILVLFFYHWDTLQRWFTATPDSESIRLMVLPFDNIGGDQSRQVFCDGLVATITGYLGQIERFEKDLWVVPAGEVRSHNITGAGEANKMFGVNYVVMGSLQQIAERLRLTVNLVDAQNIRQLHSAVIDVDASDVLGLHNESVEKLLAMLNLELKPETREVIKAGNTLVPAAFELYIQGVGYLQRYESIENIEAAIESFERSVELDQQFTLAFAGLGQAYWRKYDYTKETMWVEKANEHSRIALQMNGQLAQVNYTMGIINAGTGRYEQAIENFRNALVADPINSDVHRELATAYESLGDIEKAESTFKLAIQLKPDYWAGYNHLGAFYYRLNLYEKAIEQFKKVIDITPDNYRGYMNLGSMYYFLEEREKARTMYEHSLSLEKTYAASSNLATLYYIEGNYKDAVRMFENALEIRDGDYRLWGNLASAYYWETGNEEIALPYYQRAIQLAGKQREINPNDPMVIINLAGYRAAVGDEQEARMYIQKAFDMAPENTFIMFIAGSAFERLGDRDEALRWIGKAIQHGYSKSEIINQPELKELITDERFRDLLKNIN